MESTIGKKGDKVRILATSHPESLWYIAKGVLLGALTVLLLQVLSSGLFLAGHGNTEIAGILFLCGCLLGFVIAAAEYAGIEAFRNQWEQTWADAKITFGECFILAGIIVVLLLILAIDAYATADGAMKIGFSEEISWGFAIAQLLLFEFLFSMYFHLRDKASPPKPKQ